MGLITKQIRKRTNQKVAEALRTSTRLTIPEFIAALQDMCAAYNQRQTEEFERRQEGNVLERWTTAGKPEERHYHTQVRDRDVLVSYQKTPEAILQRKGRPGVLDKYWLAVICFPPDTPDLQPGEQHVEIELAQWVMNKDGKLQSRDKYEELTNALWEAVSTDAAA